ncbi:S-layer homology domain-containing protein [Paenibacillus lutrae]|uniref:Repeat protein (TIGR02543 family) n=1 Tax=Paenibacillus lutrae TaxID=2078573 RepID=A0A7X3FHG8_9BACL|nr:S-layer homology domain-containing protein [Paenibacillus lutrae]MVO99727.1 hypothetical protein [Paenibacillus lutrae]
MYFNRKLAKIGSLFISIMLVCSLLAGCISTSSSVNFNMQTQLSAGEQLYMRFADGTTATSADQAGKSSIAIDNPQGKQIVGAYITDGTVSWVAGYSYEGFTVKVNSIAAEKPAFAAASIQKGLPIPNSEFNGYYSVTLNVYGASGGQELPVTGRTEVFVGAPGAQFKNTDPMDSGNRNSDADGGFSSFTTDGQVTFVIKPPSGVAIEDLQLRIWSGPKLLHSDSATDLSDLKLWGGSMEPAFHPGVNSYKVKVPYSVESLSVTAAAYRPDGSLTINGAAAESGIPSGEILLNVGWNEIPVTVTLPGQTSKTYTVNVLRYTAMKGLGTKQQPYLITEPDHMDQIRQHLGLKDVYFKLAADIDMSTSIIDSGWDPIGTEKMPFKGQLDGDGFTISNLAFDLKSDGGLFGYIGEGAQIRDLKLTGVNAKSSGRVGAVAAVNQGAISDSVVAGIVQGGDVVGGLVGINDSEAVIERSAFSGQAMGNIQVGGLAGENYGTLQRSYAEAEVQSNNSAGGLAGYNDINGKIENSYAIASMSGSGSAGGIAGGNYGRIGTSYAVIKVTGGNQVGGIAGPYGYGTIEKSFYDADVANVTHPSYGLTTSQMKSAATYSDAGWDMNEIWMIDPTVHAGYPTLRLAMSRVTYYGNGQTDGTVPIDPQAYTSGSYAQIAGNAGGLVKEGYRFVGWNTAADRSGTHVAPGAQMKVGSTGLSLYAEWALDQAPELLSAKAGDASVTLEWSEVQFATGYEVYRSTLSGDYGEPVHSVSSAVHSFVDTGLTNAATYYYVVKATSPAGDSEISNELSATPIAAQGGGSEGGNTGGEDNPAGGSEGGNTGGEDNPAGGSEGGNTGGEDNPAGGSNGGSTGITPPTAGDTEQKVEIELRVNGQVIRGVSASSAAVGGRKVTTVAIGADGAKSLLAAAEEGSIVTVPVTQSADVIVLSVRGSLLKSLDEKQLTLKLQTSNASYSLPAQLIDLDAVMKQLGTIDVNDVNFEVEIASAASGMASLAKNAAAQGGFSLVVSPLEFTVRSVHGEKSVTVTQFDAYVERTIVIPDGVDPNLITTAVVVEPDGAVRHVPTKLVVLDGKYHALIQSRTNSVYALIGNEVEFADVEKHWAKTAVNEMGSRLIISGEGDGLFSPGRHITRAEFAAIVVRGLGLKLEGTNTYVSYSDVAEKAWYHDAVASASQFGLIGGFEDGTFRPNDKITREQAMVIIAKAMNLTGLQADGSTADALQPFADRDAVSKWAKEAVAGSVKAGIISGRNASELAPQASMTRAEVAEVVRKLLVKSDLI